MTDTAQCLSRFFFVNGMGCSFLCAIQYIQRRIFVLRMMVLFWPCFLCKCYIQSIITIPSRLPQNK